MGGRKKSFKVIDFSKLFIPSIRLANISKLWAMNVSMQERLLCIKHYFKGILYIKKKIKLCFVMAWERECGGHVNTLNSL